MSHEQSIGVEIGGRHFNLPTVYEGQKITDDEAVDLFKQGKLRPLGQYSTQVEADREAVKRSRSHEGFPMAEQDEGFGNFLSGLLRSITSGAQSTKDAFFEDVDAIKERRLPPQAMKTGGQVLNAMGNPSINPVIPALTHVRKVFDPATGWSEVAKTYPGGDWTQMFMRQGGLGPLLEALLKGMEKPRP